MPVALAHKPFQPFRGIESDDLPVIDDRYAIAQSVCLFHIVCCEKDRCVVIIANLTHEALHVAL